jgi:hypothetical protein
VTGCCNAGLRLQRRDAEAHETTLLVISFDSFKTWVFLVGGVLKR